jgi:hypothetical protein
MFLVNWCGQQRAPPRAHGPPPEGVRLKRNRRTRRFYSVLNYLGLYNKNAKILFLVSRGRERAGHWAQTAAGWRSRQSAGRGWPGSG